MKRTNPQIDLYREHSGALARNAEIVEQLRKGYDAADPDRRSRFRCNYFHAAEAVESEEADGAPRYVACKKAITRMVANVVFPLDPTLDLTKKLSWIDCCEIVAAVKGFAPVPTLPAAQAPALELRSAPAKGRKTFAPEPTESQVRTVQRPLFIGGDDLRGQQYLFDAR